MGRVVRVDALMPRERKVSARVHDRIDFPSFIVQTRDLVYQKRFPLVHERLQEFLHFRTCRLYNRFPHGFSFDRGLDVPRAARLARDRVRISFFSYAV